MNFSSALVLLLGATFEYYSYMLFTILLPKVSPVFFGSTKLEFAYLILFIAAIFRPLGGYILGYIADKYSRQFAISFSMMIMALSSIFLAILPPFSSIGVIAIWCVCFARILQILSVAGEYTSVAMFLIENTSGKKKEGLASSIAYFFTMLGNFLAIIMGTYVNFRIAFAFGFVLLIISYLVTQIEVESFIIKREDSYNFLNFISCVLIAAGASGMFYYNMIFLPNLFEQIVGNIDSYKIYYGLLYLIALLISGLISDYLNKLYLMNITAIFLALLAIPTIYFQNLWLHYINIFILGLFFGPIQASLYKLFPTSIRYRSVSFGYSLGTAIVGSFTPYISQILSHYGYIFSGSWLIFLCALIVLGSFLSKERLL